MKKIILLSIVIFFTSMVGLKAQNYNVNPVPSYNYLISNNVALFGELRNHQNTKEKRDMDVVISTTNHGGLPVFARVWVVKKPGHVVKGPFIVYCDQQLTVPIDNASWGVVIKCDWAVSADVWIE